MKMNCPAPIVLALRQRRIALGLTHAEMGRLLGMSARAVQSWELGKRSPDAHILDRYARALQTKLTLGSSLPSSDELDDEIMIDRACEGLVPFKRLSHAQRLGAYRKLRALSWAKQRIASQLRMSWSTISALENEISSEERVAA